MLECCCECWLVACCDHGCGEALSEFVCDGWAAEYAEGVLGWGGVAGGLEWSAGCCCFDAFGEGDDWCAGGDVWGEVADDLIDELDGDADGDEFGVGEG